MFHELIALPNTGTGFFFTVMYCSSQFRPVQCACNFVAVEFGRFRKIVLGVP